VESIAVQGHRNRPFAVAFSPTGKMFASGSAGPVLRVWKPKAIEPEAFGVIANEDAPTIAISSLAFSHDGKYVIAASHLGKDSLQMWDTSGDFLDDKALPDATARIVACAPKEPVLAFAGDDAIVHLWNFGAPKVTKLHQLPGHPGKAATPLVKALAFSPDGKTMASAGQDKSVRIWNTATGEKTLEWLLPHEPRAVAFSSEGRHLAIGNSDGAIFVVRLAAAKSRSN
jgi:WD40 repeat protein